MVVFSASEIFFGICEVILPNHCKVRQLFANGRKSGTAPDTSRENDCTPYSVSIQGTPLAWCQACLEEEVGKDGCSPGREIDYHSAFETCYSNKSCLWFTKLNYKPSDTRCGVSTSLSSSMSENNGHFSQRITIRHDNCKLTKRAIAARNYTSFLKWRFCA